MLTHTHTHTHTDYTELPLSRNAVLESIQGFQGQRDLHRPLLCEGGLICKGETTQLLFMLITGGWIWQLDKTHTHTHTHTHTVRSKQHCVSRLQLQGESQCISLIWRHCLLHADIEHSHAVMLFNHQVVLLQELLWSLLCYIKVTLSTALAVV